MKASVVDFKAKDWYLSKVDHKIHNVYYSVDKVEPKFKVGDWILTDKNHIWYVDEDCSTTGYLYRLVAINGKVEVAECEVVDKHARLWTIADAKDGDILVSKSRNKIFSYRGNLDLRGRPCAYYGIYKVHDGIRFSPCAIGNYFTYEDVHPATKEQCDQLEEAMAEAGYTFDFDKKELNKIEAPRL